jgi:Putative peptidoglycan binding domain
MTDIALTLRARARTAATRKSPPISASSGAGATLGLIGRGLARMARRAARRPARTLVQLCVLGVGGLIIINALSFQNARHPAFQAARSQGTTAEMLVDRPPLPPSRPAEISPARTMSSTPASREVIGAAPVSAQPAAPARNGDPIGELLRGEGPRGDVPRGDNSAATQPARPVIAAQRALAKLGYTQVKADGVPGEATRAAIERFERERKLPVTGQLNPRTLRELAAASGMKLD